MKLTYYIIFFLFLFVNNIYSVDLVDDQCLNAVLLKVQSSNFNGYNKSTICSNSNFFLQCDSNGYITSLSLSFSLQTLTWNDFYCFSKLNTLLLTEIDLESEFLYIANISTLTLKSTNIIEINKIIPKNMTKLSIDTLSSPVKTSYLKNIRSIEFINENIGFELDADVVTSTALKTFSIYSNKLPNLSNLPELIDCRFKFIVPFDETTITNFGSFATRCESIVVSATSAFDFEFPQSFQTVVNPIYNSILFGNFMYLKTNSLIDLSNNVNSKKVGRFSWINSYSGSNFHVDGRFPFSNFPKNYSSFYFDMFQSYFEILPDLSMFKDGYGFNPTISIRSSITKNGTLQANDGIFTGMSKIVLSDNNLIGPLDPSWCNGVDLDVSNNKLSGELPLCYYCYLDDINVNQKLIGNGFSNFGFTDRSNCNYKTIVPNVELLSSGSYARSFKIWGENLGYTISNVKLSDGGTLSYENYGNLLNGYINSPVNKFNFTIVSLGLVYTLSSSNTPPIIEKFIQNNDTLSFIGQFFTYNLTDSKIYIDNYQYCEIQSTTFYQIDCKLNKQLRDRGSRPTTFTVKNLQNTTNINYEYLTLECNGSCGNGYCNTVNGTCVCYKNWITVQGYGSCMVPSHYASSVIQVPVKVGGDLVILGWFGTLHDNLSVKIANQDVPIISKDENSITVSVGPGFGLKEIQITQNQHSWIGKFYIYYDPIVLCPNNCTNNGICNSGECKCNKGWSMQDCSVQSNNNTSNNPVPSVNNGIVQFFSDEINFLVSITSINEIDINGKVVDTWTLGKIWNSYNHTDNPLISTFFQNRGKDNSTLTLKVEQVEEKEKKFSFAGIDFTVEAGGVKFSLELKEWNYKSNLNTLQIEISANSDIVDNPCVTIHNESVESSSSNTQIADNVNYLKIIKDDKILFGRFLSRMLSDSNPIDIQTFIKSNSSEKVSVVISMPRCEECILDPDFSVLINTNVKKENKCDNGRKNWVLPVAVIIPVVVVAIIIVVVVVYTKKNSVDLRVGLRNVSMKSFTDRSRK